MQNLKCQNGGSCTKLANGVSRVKMGIIHRQPFGGSGAEQTIIGA